MTNASRGVANIRSMRLALIHTSPGAAAAPDGATAWRTCLREIHFLSVDDASAAAEVLTDAEAYALLLEVVCGLRSPLLGETEVQAQFKAFLAAEAAGAQPWLAGLGQRVLGDAKRIRHKYLQGFGAHSYGRLAARYLAARHIAVVGTGALAGQVIESAPTAVTVDVWGRTAARLLPAREGGVRFSLLADAPQVSTRYEPTTLVIAAPVSAGDLAAVVGRYAAVENVVDLRSADQQTPVPVDAPVVRLADLLAQAASSSGADASQVGAARAEIRALAAAFVRREDIRPFGWDDVCA